MTYTCARRWLLRSVLVAGAMLPMECVVAQTTGPVLDIQDQLLTSAMPPCTTAAVTQDISVNRTMRATNIDGTPRAAAPFGMRFFANPFEPSAGCTGPIWMSVNTFTGVYATTDVDVAMPALGPEFSVVRSYNSRQHDGPSDGFQGINWYQGSVPSLFLGNDDDKCGLLPDGSGGGGDDDRDVLYLILGADRYIELVQTAKDTDIRTSFAYQNGHMQSMWVDLDADGNIDGGTFPAGEQVTEYTYGVISGSGTLPSVIFSNDLLRSAIYPKQSSGQSAGDRTVLYAYNALGEQITTQDQNGTVHHLGYDTGGRRTVDYVSAHGTGIDTLVDKVELTYTYRGQVDTVTQFDSTTAVDQVQYAYDGWGNVKQFIQDRNGLIGAGTDDHVTVAYTYALATPSGGRVAVRRTNQTITHAGGGGGAAQTLNYTYGSSGTVDALLSRVYEVEYDPGSEYPVARYEYLGLATKVGTILPDANMISRLHDNAGSPAYDGLDNFDRVTKSRWVSTNATPYYQTSPSYDAASNITQTVDAILKRRDVKYTIDGLDRVINAAEGTISSTSIVSGTESRKEDWTTMSQTGNWLRFKRWLDDGAGSPLLDVEGSFSEANELLGRDITPGASPSTPEMEPAYDKAGNQTEDGQHFKYVYDAWGRLVGVWDQADTPGTDPPAARYKYNGLGYRIGWQDEAGEAEWLWLTHNDRWQQVGSWRCEDWAYDSDNDTIPKELFINHHAGLDGMGGSSYIDDVIRRDADEVDGSYDPSWLDETTGLDDTLYYLQNWRADVVVTVRPAVESGDPALVDQVRYSAYGVPWAISLADMVPAGGTGASAFSPDGELMYEDIDAFTTWYGDDDLKADIVSVGGTSEAPSPPDGQLTLDDVLVFVNAYGNDGGGATGRGVLSRTHSRRGYAGYEYDPGLMHTSYMQANGAPRAMWHVRHRVLDSETGRWTRRDPLGYVDGMGLYEYVRSSTLRLVDGLGLVADEALSCSGNDGNAPGPDLSPGDKLRCCQEGRAARKRRGQTSFAWAYCCQGKRVICISGDDIYDDALGSDSVQQMFTSCLRTCEPMHCPNITCAIPGAPDVPVDGHNDPFTRPGALTRDCSECVANRCALECMSSKCSRYGVLSVQYMACQNILAKLRRNVDKHCRDCLSGPIRNPQGLAVTSCGR